MAKAPAVVRMLTRAQVAQQGDGKDGRPSWIIVNGDVLNVTKFSMLHPGGKQVLLDYAGQDATEVFYSLHVHDVLERYRRKLMVGTIDDYDAKMTPTSWNELSAVPYAEIDMEGSPFFNESHERFRLECRRFFHEEGIATWCEKAENSGVNPPRELYEKLGRSGYFAMCLGIGPHLKAIPEPNLWSRAGLTVDQLDLFHFSILGEERTRIMCPGAEDALSSGVSIGLGPVMNFGQPWVQEEVVRPCLLGSKTICLAITEPYAGSDVAGVTTRAVLSEDGSHYIVTGTKKWITNGVFSDYFTTLVRTSDAKGARGLSMLLIEKSDQVVVRPIPTEYSISAGTALVSFEGAKVPVRNLLGQTGKGMMITMHNFNMERLGICTMALGRARRVIEETMLWANQRKAFGKTLLSQPVIRNHIGKMISEHRAAYSFYLLLTYKYQTTPKRQQGLLGGETALLKYRTTRACTLISDLAVQVFGGRGVSKTGMGKHIARFQKSFKFASVYGGSEEIMLDLGVRQAMKQMPINARL